MFRKLALTTGLAVCTVAAAPAFAGGDCGGVNSGDANLNELNPYYYNGGDATKTADSGIPHLPAYYGQMQTNDVYRFFNVNEMVATMIGEGKHGMWRYQDNGTVREYLQPEANGIRAYNDDGTLRDLTFTASLEVITSDYSHLTSHDLSDDPVNGGFAGYRSDSYAPAHDLEFETIDQATGITDNGTPLDTSDDYRVWVDLPINHAKYDGNDEHGSYDNHVPIDLAGYYCTMSNYEYPNARAAWRSAVAQSGANKVGPLGERAGLDIKENYLNVLRLNLFPDANAWVNVSGDADVIDWQAVDADKTPFEVYLVERPFFNEEYLFYVVVFGDKTSSYIRPDGAYYEHLLDRGLKAGKDFSTILNHSPTFALEEGGFSEAQPVNLFGTHHPGGAGMTITNGACPAMGGDYGASYYGASWPNTYQEVTPLCDAVMLDIKAYANLDDGEANATSDSNSNWNSAAKYLPNATIDDGSGGQIANSGDRDGDSSPLTRGYIDTPRVADDGTLLDYGTYTDSYLTDRGISNPEAFTATGTQNKTYQTAQPAVTAEESKPFTSSLGL